MNPEQYDHARRIAYGIVYRRFRWMDDAEKEDLVQAGVIRVWRRGALVEPAHMAKEAHNGIVDEFRRLYGRRTEGPKIRGRLDQIDVTETAEYIGADHDFTSLDAQAILGCLPKRERRIIVRLTQGYHLHEIGTEMGVTESRISQLRASAKRHIKHSRILEAA